MQLLFCLYFPWAPSFRPGPDVTVKPIGYNESVWVGDLRLVRSKF